MTAMEQLPVWLMIIAWCALFVLAVMWVLLPLAIYGVKRRLESQVRGLQAVNKNLERLVRKQDQA